MNAIERLWVVVFNSNSCKIFKHIKNSKQIELVEEINHPENKLRDIELTSDEPGHYKASNSAHGTYSQPTDPKEIKIDTFASLIAHKLDEGRNANEYDKLIIIAAPHMNGLFHKHINKHVERMISKNITKDLTQRSTQDLIEILKN